jgi:hypothetical protein
MFVKAVQHLLGAVVAFSAFVVQGVVIYAGLWPELNKIE